MQSRDIAKRLSSLAESPLSIVGEPVERLLLLRIEEASSGRSPAKCWCFLFTISVQEQPFFAEVAYIMPELSRSFYYLVPVVFMENPRTQKLSAAGPQESMDYHSVAQAQAEPNPTSCSTRPHPDDVRRSDRVEELLYGFSP